jgi:hypothetical protein
MGTVNVIRYLRAQMNFCPTFYVLLDLGKIQFKGCSHNVVENL